MGFELLIHFFDIFVELFALVFLNLFCHLFVLGEIAEFKALHISEAEKHKVKSVFLLNRVLAVAPGVQLELAQRVFGQLEVSQAFFAVH